MYKPGNMIDNVMGVKIMKMYLLSYPNDSGTPGDLIINRKIFCHTLEDIYRPNGVKIHGETCIPEGIYEVKLTLSNRFQKVLPELLNVPNFTGIRIHGGNTTADTEGCILAAYNIVDTNTIQGRASDDLITLLQGTEQHFIQIIRSKATWI